MVDSAHDVKELYDHEPLTGWGVLTRHPTVSRMVDAILDYTPHFQFTQESLANHADVSRQSVSKHIGILLELGVIERVSDPEEEPYKYQIQEESDVFEMLVRLDGAVNQHGPFA